MSTAVASAAPETDRFQTREELVQYIEQQTTAALEDGQVSASGRAAFSNAQLDSALAFGLMAIKGQLQSRAALDSRARE